MSNPGWLCQTQVPRDWAAGALWGRQWIVSELAIVPSTDAGGEAQS